MTRRGVVSFGFPRVAALSFSLVLVTAPAAAQTFLAKLTANDRTPGGMFGISVATDDGVPVVGTLISESACLFDASGNQRAKLTAEDGWPYLFGISVATDNKVTLVGAAGSRVLSNGQISSGSAYLFDTTGNQIAKLIPENGAASDLFGFSVAIDDGVSLVGAPDDSNGEGSGSAYLFDFAGNQTAKLTPDDGAADDSFGVSVAIDGSIALVGAHEHTADGVRSGAAYLFDTAGNQAAKLTPDDGAANELFGVSVAIDGDVALVGASGDDDNGSLSGSAYLFDTATGQ